MTRHFSAIYVDGVFRPLTPVDLPDQTPVVVTQASVPGNGAGIRASAGSWAGEDAALDQWLAKLAEMRRSERALLRSDEDER